MVNATPDELRLIESVKRGEDEHRWRLLEALLGTLLSDLLSLEPRALDGVLLSREERPASGYLAVGFAVLIDDQSVEPFRLRLAISPDGTLTSGSVEFGVVASSPVPYGSREHMHLSKWLMAFPEDTRGRVAWRYRMERGADGWTRSTT